jgi:hypothetical protein
MGEGCEEEAAGFVPWANKIGFGELAERKKKRRKGIGTGTAWAEGELAPMERRNKRRPEMINTEEGDEAEKEKRRNEGGGDKMANGIWRS